VGELQKKSDQRLTVRGWLEQQRNEIARAVPQHIDPERLIRVALTACNQNSNLLTCTKESLLQAVMQSAQLGLMPDGILGQAYLIPYKDKAQFQVGYQGLIELVGRAERIAAIIPDVVHEKDEFEWHREVDRDHFVHKPYEGPDDPGAITHGYCIIRRKDGTSSVTVLSIYKIEREHMAHSQAVKRGGDTPWKSHKDAMVKKTMILVALKYEPKSTELAKVVAREELSEQGIDLPDEVPGPVDAEIVAPTPTLDKLADKIGSTTAIEAAAQAAEPPKTGRLI
jgi:recombination protein RecT